MSTAIAAPSTAPSTAIPDGFRLDAQGRLVPESMIKPIDLTRDRLVIELSAQAQCLAKALEAFKACAFADIGAFVDLSAEQYGVQLGGRRGNLTLVSFDGRYKITVAVADRLVFDERLQAAKALIDECLSGWTDGSRAELKVAINYTFQTDKEGKINTGRVLEMRRWDITDPKWQTAMTAISDSLQVAGSKEYVRFYERIGSSDQYRAICLDIAAISVPV